jgi:hypothetical protein
VHLVTGSFGFNEGHKTSPAVTIWENQKSLTQSCQDAKK